MGSTDCCGLRFSSRGVGAALTLVLLVLVGAGLAWGATGSIGGSANPLPENSSPALNDVYNVGLEISNTSKSTSQPPNPGTGMLNQKNIMVNVTSAEFILACSGSPCDPTDGNQTPGVVTFFPTTPNTCEAGSDPCVTACTVDGTGNIVTVTTTGCTLNPGQAGALLAIIRVKQTATPGTFVMGGRASYQGTAGTCVSGVCNNVATPNSCTTNADCNFTVATGDATGNTNFFPEFCGDNIVQTSLGETCDPPGSVPSTPAGNQNVCRANCTYCGDGIVNNGEQCDDGNAVNTDACRNDCTLPFCGDGILDAGEQCDGTVFKAGAPATHGPCRADCTFCGDGIVNDAEQCDDGNAVNTDACRNDCILPRCGDGILDPGEQCDTNQFPPGAPATHGPCRTDCTFCGDGIVNDAEQCDDGNAVDHDGCTTTCQTELCDVRADKQVSCDGTNWFDAGLVKANNDGTNGPVPGCVFNQPVFVRYQVQNVGQVDVTNCTLSESNSVIQPGNTVQSGFSIAFNTTLPPTAADSNQNCTDSLTAQEPDTATLSCDCVQPSLPPLSVQAQDTATVECVAECGDGIVGNTPGETCDPPGSVQANGNVCRNDCTFCGDGIVQTADGEACDGTPGCGSDCTSPTTTLPQQLPRATIPTLSEWGMAMMAALLVLLALVALRRPQGPRSAG